MINKIIACLLVLIFVCSCGEKPLSDQETFVSTSLKSSCEVDTKIFEKFFKEPIPEAIDCLEKSLNQFVNYVKREDDDSIGLAELERFAVKFFPKDPVKLSGALKIFFRVNSLLLNDPSNRLSTKHIAPIFKMIHLINKEAVIISELLKEENRANKDLWKIRKSYNDVLVEFRNVTLEIIPQNSQHTNDINLHDLLVDLKKNVGNGNLDIDLFESLLFAKKILLGGSSDSVNANELRRLVSLAPEYGLLIFDILYMDENQFASKNERLAFFSKRLEDVRPLLYPWGQGEVIFSKGQLLTAAQELELKEADLRKVDLGIDIVKSYLLGGEKRNFTYHDLNTLISLGRVGFEALEIANAYKESSDRVDQNAESRLSESLRFKEFTARQVSNIKTIINSAPILPSTIDFQGFLKDLNESLLLTDSEEKEEILRTTQGLKKLIAGGKGDVVTEREIRTLLDKIPEYASFAFELVKTKKSTFRKDYDYYNFLMGKLDVFTELTKQNYPEEEVLFDIQELMIFAERLAGKPEVEDIPGSMDRTINFMAFTKYSKSLVTILPKAYPTTEKGKITYKTLRSILKDGREALEALIFTDVGYEQYETIITDSKVITKDLPVAFTKNLALINPQNLTTLQTYFNQVARNYRFFPSDKGLPFYGKEIKRHHNGFVLMGAFKWGANFTLNAYGKPSDPADPKSRKILDVKALDTLVRDLEGALRHLDLWPKNIKTFPGNMLLISDFFEYQSDGSMTMNDDELSEYIVLLFATGKMSTDLYKDLLGKCDYLSQDYESGRVSGFKQECVLKNYAESLFVTTNHKEHLTEVNTYREKASPEEFTTFVNSLIGFIRDNPAGSPMEKRELTLLIAAMLDIESTFLRFDANNDGLIAGQEMDNTFNVYKSGIILVAKLKPSQEKFAKSIFYFMIKYLRLPTQAELLKFHFLQDKDKITSKRLNLGVLLYYLAQQANKPQP